MLKFGGLFLKTKTNFGIKSITLHTKDAPNSHAIYNTDKNGNKNPSDIALMLETMIFIKLNVPIPCRLRGNDRNNVLFMQSYEVSTSSLQYM